MTEEERKGKVERSGIGAVRCSQNDTDEIGKKKNERRRIWEDDLAERQGNWRDRKRKTKKIDCRRRRRKELRRRIQKEWKDRGSEKGVVSYYLVCFFSLPPQSIVYPSLTGGGGEHGTYCLPIVHCPIHCLCPDPSCHPSYIVFIRVSHFRGFQFFHN